MFEINAAARANFDQKALAILMCIKELPPIEHGPSRFPVEAHITNEIGDADVVGDMTQFAVDAKGRICERVFIHDGQRVGLIRSDYGSFTAVAENVQRLKGIRDQVSVKFVEDALFSWLKEAYQAGSVKIQFLEYLESCARKTIEKTCIYVPMAFVSVELPFDFGDIKIENISKALVDAHVPPLTSLPAEAQAQAQLYFESFRTEFQGYAAIRLDLVCEPYFAKELGLQRAHAVADLLGIYSGKTLIPDERCSSRLKGAEFIEKSTVITIGESKGLVVSQDIVDIKSAETWFISKDELAQYRKFGFDDLSDLVRSGGVSDFEKSILNVAFLYSKSAFTSEPMEKVVYILSALESIFLKNQSEPIQQNLGERMAIFSATELAERKAILRNVRAVYELRSRYLHHGHSSTEIEEIGAFLLNVWVFFVKLVCIRKDFKTKDEFLVCIDDEKLS